MSPNASSHTTLHQEFMSFAQDDLSLATLAEWAERQGWPSACAQVGGIEYLLHLVEQTPPPKIIFVDLDAGNSHAANDPVQLITQLIGKLDKDHRVVAFGTVNDVGLYRRIINTGVSDYLVKPLTHDMLTQALATVQQAEHITPGSKKSCKTVFVLGARGGIGASTIALNLAWLFADKNRLQTALLDLDMHFGISALALDVEPGRGLRDIVSAPHRVDGLMIASSMTQVTPSLSVLASEEPIDDPVFIDTAAIAALLKELQSHFNMVLVDMPRHLLMAHKRLVTKADSVVIVTEMSLPGMRDALRLKNLVKSFDTPAQIMLVGARANAHAAGQIDRDAFEKGAQGRLDAIVPEDAKVAAQAANSGKTMMRLAPHAPACQAITALGKKIIGETQKARASMPWWRQLIPPALPKITPMAKVASMTKVNV